MHPGSPKLYTIESGFWAEFWKLLQRTFVAGYEDNFFGIAKGVAYSSLTSFVPVLTSVTAILVQANARSVSRELSDFLFEVVPPGSETLVYEFTTRGKRPIWILVFATLLSIWAASGAMLSLMEGFQAAYRLPTGRPFLKQRGIGILLVFIAAIPAILASMLILFGHRAEAVFMGWVGMAHSESDLRGWVAFLGQAVRYLVALGTIAGVAGMLYFVGPNRPMRFGSVWPGAILATCLWLLATTIFAWYVRNIANYNVFYGSIGAVIALQIWMYIISIIALYGCEFNAERERFGSR